MKTTIELSEQVLEEARRLAAQRGVTLGELVEEGLGRVFDLERKEVATRPFRLRKATFNGQGLSADAHGLSWEHLRQLGFEGRGA